jgi:hypothetical protein
VGRGARGQPTPFDQPRHVAGDCFITANPSVFMPKLSLEVSVRSGGLGAVNPQPLPAPTQPVTLPAASAPRCP